MALQAVAIVAAIASVLLAFMIRLAHWLDRREDRRWREQWALEWAQIRAAGEEDHNPGGPLTEKQAGKMLEDILQAAIRQKAESVLIDSLSGRPQVRLQLEGKYQELTGVGDAESFRRLVAQARACAGLARAPAPGGTGSFLRLYRKGHLRAVGVQSGGEEISWAFDEYSRRNRAVRFDLESFPAPSGEALKIALRPEIAPERTRLDLGFAREDEGRFIRAARSRSGIVLLTGPCNSGKSTATYNILSILRDEGRRIVTVEWPVERKLKGVLQYDLGYRLAAYDYVQACLKRAMRIHPDVLMLQNIDWVNDDDARAAIEFASAGGLLITAVHSRGCAWGLSNIFFRHFFNQRKDIAELLRIVVSPRQLFMVCAHCAEEHRVPARAFRVAGMSDPPVGADGRVATWRGRGCPLCGNSGEQGSIAVYEVLDLAGEMRRFLDNANEWNTGQLEYLERQAWQHGMRTQRELALERVVAGDISLQAALLNTTKPKWLAAAQAARRRGREKEER